MISLKFIKALLLPGRIAQSVWHLTRKSEVLGSIPGLATYPVLLFLLPLIQEGQLSVTGENMCMKYWLNRFGGLSLLRKSVVRLTDRPDMTLDVYCGRKTTTQQSPVICHFLAHLSTKCSW